MARKRGRRSPTGRNRSYLPYAAATVAAALIAAVLIVTLGRGDSDDGDGPLVPPGSQITATNSGQGHVLGSRDAPVSLVEYEDLQCPHCAAAAVNVLPQIEEEFLPGGQVSIESRPIAVLGPGPGSELAAQAVECAADQGRFWDFRQAVFLNQRNVDFSADGMGEVAALLELDQESFTSCLASGRYAEQVSERTQTAFNRGVTGVPTIFVNGRKVSTSLDALRAAIQGELDAQQ